MLFRSVSQSRYDTATKQEILQYINAQSGNGIKNLNIAALKLFYKYCLRNGDVQHNPMASISYVRTHAKSKISIFFPSMAAILNSVYLSFITNLGLYMLE